MENLLEAWREFLPGKRKRTDVAEFSVHLMDNILELHRELVGKTYRHGPYVAFKINDPKPRDIHKASVRDRLLHHAIYRILYPYFDSKFIFNSFSCRRGKGVHRAVNRLREMAGKVSQNHTQTVWVLKCDIKKFFASIDHKILMEILRKFIPDKDIVGLLEKIIESFNFQTNGKGLPLGNLTSQLFCNIYMNEFDQYVKHRLKIKYYIRYADDFVFLADSKKALVLLIPQIAGFLDERLKLSLHPKKVFIKTLASGVDFLGWVNFSHHRLLRKVTKRRMFRGIRLRPKGETLQSYLGLLKHGNTFGLKQEVLNWYGLLADKNL